MNDCVPRGGAYFGELIPIPFMAAIETPCEKICIVDHSSGLCRGCGRSLAEIERWTVFSDGERAQIMAELPRRLQSMNARPAAQAAALDRRG
jgi:predicted Fe-S protein YdhL (DUF1289 family)